MANVDKYMIPLTVAIVIGALIPFVAPDIDWDQNQQTGTAGAGSGTKTPSLVNDEKYFEQLDENIEDAKDIVRDLMAEHEANNP